MNVSAGISKGGNTGARTNTEQTIGRGKITYFSIIIILGCFKVLMEPLWKTGSFYSE